MILYVRRMLRMTKLFAQGRISRHSLFLSLKPKQVAVCMTGGGMVFCDYRDEAFYLGE